MDLWKIKDCFGRVYFFEDIKKFKRRVKISEWDYHKHNSTHMNASWFSKPKYTQVVNDQWVEIEAIPPAELVDYIAKKQYKEDKWKWQMEQRRLARMQGKVI